MKRYFLTLIMISCVRIFGQDASWLTFYEKSGFKETPRFAETMSFCSRLDAASDWVTVTSFGKSPQGRNLPLVIVDKDGFTDPARIRNAGRIVLLVQCCIHAGECEGKDAMLMLIRDMVIKKSHSELLDKISILFIPIFNVDGHERFGPYNRINQNGPKEMGWRTTADNLNLNRDYLKADAPEMQAWLAMFNRWMPDFFIDTHSTDGADYQYTLTYMTEIYGNMDKGLTDWLKGSYGPAMEKSMNEKKILICPYVSFRTWTDLSSGIIYHPSPPMLSQGYTALRNRPGLLIETHMLKPYQQRVTATYECIISTMDYLSSQTDQLKNLIKAADQYSASPEFRTVDFPAQFKTVETDSTMISFLGKKYELVKSENTGDTYYKYSDQPDTFLLPSFQNNIPSVLLKLPEAYIIPAEWETVIERLSYHGIRMFKMPEAVTLDIQTYQFINPKWQLTPYEGRHSVANIEYLEINEKRTFPAGTVIVPMDQPSSRVIAQMLEPKGQGSLLYWGFFDAIFEQKEYVEEYVIEPMITKMLAENPELKKEFEEKKSKDPLFAKNPQMITNWFFMKTPYFDSRKNIYPIGKISDRKVLNSLFEQSKSN
jgi:hypothetical protein